MTDLVLGDGGERDVLLDVRSATRPLRVPVAQDEFVVGERQ